MVSPNPEALRRRIARALAAEHSALAAVIGRMKAAGQDVAGLQRLAKKIRAALMEAEKGEGGAD